MTNDEDREVENEEGRIRNFVTMKQQGSWTACNGFLLTIANEKPCRDDSENPNDHSMLSGLMYGRT